MNLVLIYLTEEQFATDVVLAMAQVFENRAYVISATAGPDQLAAHIPIFSDFSSASGTRGSFCKVIHTVTEAENPIDQLTAALAEGGIDFRKQRLGSICVLPLKSTLIAESDN